MIIGEPLGLLALAGVPALLALHLWRARHAPHAVSGLFLWPLDRRILATGRTRAPLLLRASFWLELAAILALAWWLADLHLAPREQARHLVLVLDDRWRMQARAADGRSSAERLRANLDLRLAALAEGDRATLIASGTPPRLLAGPAGSPAEARAALATWAPDAAWHDLDPALTLAAGIAGAGAELVLGSDRIPEHLPAGIGAVATGIAAASSGLADVRWWRDAGGERIVAVAYADRARTRRLRLSHAGIELASAQLSLEAGRPAMQVFDHLPAALPEGAACELALDGDDALPIDDRVALIRPAARVLHARVDLDGPAATAARAALAAAGASLEEDGHPGVVVGRAAVAGIFSVVLTAGDGPATLGPFTAAHSHPLLQDADLTGVIWSGSASAASGLPLLISGGQTLISAEPAALRLHLDPARSNLFQANAWPVLIANLVAWRSSLLPGLSDPDPRCGQALSATLPAGIREAVLRGPDGERRLRADPAGQVAIPGLARPGSWELRAGGAVWPISALPLDTRQADLRAAATASLAPTPAGRGAVERRRDALAALLPLVLAAAAGLGAWVAFRREEGA